MHIYCPVPLSAILCGEPVALSVIVTAAASEPVFVGAKWPWMVQLAATARLVPQLFAKTNEDAFAPVTAMLDMDKTAVPVLVMVTDCELLAVPTVVAGYTSLVADRVTGSATPVPLNLMVCGDPVALSVMVTAAVNAPPVVGAKCPWMVQFAPTARLVPHVFANTNEEALVPVTAMLLMDKAAVPALVMVTDCELLEVPTVVAENTRLVADRFTGGASPVPLNAIVCGEPAALSAMVMAAFNAPAATGAKWPWMVQLTPTARLVPQVFANTNEEALVPVTAMLPMDNAAVPVLVIVTDCDPLAAPTLTEPNDKLAADRVTGGVTPVPLNATLCGDPVALSATFRTAVSDPMAAGFNSTEMVQLSLTASVPPQVLADFRNEVASAPLKLVAPKVTIAALVFLSVTSCAAEATPSGVEPKVRLAGVSVTVRVPVPLRGTVCGDPVALSATFRDAVSVPAANGLNVTVIEQEALIARVVPQVFVSEY